MVEWAVTDDGVVACAPDARTTVDVDTWRPATPEVPVSRPVETAVAGVVGELALPGRLRTPEGAVHPPAAVRGDSGRLTVEDEPTVFLAFDGTASVSGPETAPGMEFDGDRVVALGFSGDAGPQATVTVPGTAAGLATYVTHATASLRTTAPDRSHPALRGHPPRLAVGEESVPESVAAAAPATELELRVPEDVAHVFVGAPLAYYLGASVTVGGTEPVLVGESPIRSFEPLPTFQAQVAALLRRVFALDASVRSTAGAPDPPLPAAVREASPAERLRRYLEVPEDDLPSPTWHLSTYVDPELDRARCLPYLLDRLSLIYLAESTPLEGRDLLQRALDDFIRAPDVAPSVDQLDPHLRPGAAHAWLADGTPIDAFTTGARAHENRLERAHRGGPLSVELVLNAPEMDDERTVAEEYRCGVSGHPIDVTVHERVPTASLARVFEDGGDLVHYVGHCEVDGLVCPDGTLDTGSLTSVGTRTVFLNACGSVHEGRKLVRAGAAAGAVTLTPVLNDQAATVGTAFARLLSAGVTFQRAMKLARSGVMMGKDYAVVGDGTVAVAPPYGHPGVLRVASTPAGYETEYRVVSPRAPGRRYRDPFDGTWRLYGTPASATLGTSDLCELCRERSLPVVLDGEVRTTDAVLAELG